MILVKQGPVIDTFGPSIMSYHQQASRLSQIKHMQTRAQYLTGKSIIIEKLVCRSQNKNFLWKLCFCVMMNDCYSNQSLKANAKIILWSETTSSFEDEN